MFPGRSVFHPADIEHYKNSTTVQSAHGQIAVIAKYLKLNLKLTDTEKFKIQVSTLPLSKAIRKYLFSLKRKNYAATSIRYSKYVLLLFYKFCLDNEIQKVADITSQVVIAFKHHLYVKQTSQGKNYAISTQRSALHILRALFDYLCEEEYAVQNPARKIKTPREEKKISRNYLTRKEAKSFLDVIDTSTVYGFFDRTLFEVLYATGMRIQELLHLKIRQVNLADMLVTVLDGKGRKDRVCILTESAKKYLSAYFTQVRTRHLNKGSEAPYVFPSIQGNMLEEKYISKRIRRYCLIAGIKKRITCHAFRRSFATHLLEKGADIRHIQRLLGHSKIDTTMRYIKITVSDLRNVLVRYHPREKKMAGKEVTFKGTTRYSCAH